MGLHLGAVFALDDDVGLREALGAASPRGPAPGRARCRQRQSAPRGKPEGWPSGAVFAGRRRQRRVGARALSMSTTKGSGLVVDADQRSASSAAAIETAATAATGAPT
jgi:hypothetical protein